MDSYRCLYLKGSNLFMLISGTWEITQFKREISTVVFSFLQLVCAVQKLNTIYFILLKNIIFPHPLLSNPFCQKRTFQHKLPVSCFGKVFPTLVLHESAEGYITWMGSPNLTQNQGQRSRADSQLYTLPYFQVELT